MTATTSYPLMRLAQRLGLSYGTALTYADEKLWAPTLTRWARQPPEVAVSAPAEVLRGPSEFGAATVWRARAHAELQKRGLLTHADLELSLLLERGEVYHPARRTKDGSNHDQRR